MDSNNVPVTGIIVAGGRGQRMGRDVAKQYLLLCGVPILVLTLRVFERCKRIRELVLVVPETDIDYCRKHIVQEHEIRKSVNIVSGGQERQESVYNGLKACRQQNGFVAIHDAVRPLLTTVLLESCIQQAVKTGGCIPALPVSETIKAVNRTATITRTVPRNGLWLAQTPQIFKYSEVYQAHQAAQEQKKIATDDAQLMEWAGFSISVAPGEVSNIKITRPVDLAMAEFFIQRSTNQHQAGRNRSESYPNQ